MSELGITFDQLPEQAKQTLIRLAQKQGVNVEEIFNQFIDYIRITRIIEKLPSKFSLESKLIYAVQVFTVQRLRKSAGLIKKQFAIFGYSPPLPSKKDPSTIIYQILAIDLSRSPPEPCLIIARGSSSHFVDTLELFNVYEMEVAQLPRPKTYLLDESSEINRIGDLSDILEELRRQYETAGIQNVEEFDLKFTLYRQFFNVDEIRVIEIPRKLSKMQGDYIDIFDLKAIRAFVTQKRRIVKQGREIVVFEITDLDSVFNEEGIRIGESSTNTAVVWAHVKYDIYEPQSQLMFIGTTRLHPQTNVPMLSCLAIIPIVPITKI